MFSQQSTVFFFSNLNLCFAFSSLFSFSFHIFFSFHLPYVLSYSSPSMSRIEIKQGRKTSSKSTNKQTMLYAGVYGKRNMVKINFYSLFFSVVLLCCFFFVCVFIGSLIFILFFLCFPFSISSGLRTIFSFELHTNKWMNGIRVESIWEGSFVCAFFLVLPLSIKYNNLCHVNVVGCECACGGNWENEEAAICRKEKSFPHSITSALAKSDSGYCNNLKL